MAEQEKVSDLHQPTRQGQTVTIADGYLTREDVDLLRRPELVEGYASDITPERLASLAARIQALLPPEPTL